MCSSSHRFRTLPLVVLGLCGAVAVPSLAAPTAPLAVHMPGTQPGEVSQVQSVSKCDNCHGNFEQSGEPWFNWSGSAMAHASRDPIFWATVAIAEQDFDGSGDLCLRCHVPEGWHGGRSEPTDGSALADPGDADGVQCDVCHRLTNPDASEIAGVQNPPFVANDGGNPAEGFYGSSMLVLSDGSAKLGPYDDATARHQFEASRFHRDSALCGSCHDVSNPVTGDLSPTHGAQLPLAPGTFSDDPASPVQQKAAFNNPAYKYGAVERTFSEHQASAFATTPVSAYPALPPELQAGAIQRAWQAAQLAGRGGDYADGTTRLFSCQSCHMRPTVGQGCDKNPPVRSDLPVHDLTGGNYWLPQVLAYQDARGQLRLGGGLTSDQQSALLAGSIRARQNLDDAASLTISGNVARVTNLTGHKLISGYPEGRRMWLRVRWYDNAGVLLADDGAYGSLAVSPIPVTIDGTPTQIAQVETLLELAPAYTPVYEAHGAISQEWAADLVALGTSPTLPVAYDRATGAVARTLGDVAAQAPGSHGESFHFVLNDTLADDDRIPPWGLDAQMAAERSLLPVPSDRYPVTNGVYAHWDDVPLNPPAGAASATVELLYQPTSWEYVQFLHLANDRSGGFLTDEGEKLLVAWHETGMAAPYVMARATWQETVTACADGIDNDGDGAVDYPADPGCSATTDDSENAAGLDCDDRIDGDGDGLVDYPRDPGCSGPQGIEAPACNDGIDNDGDGKIDFDGGPGGGVPDPQCDVASKNRESASGRGCGVGVELALLLPALGWLRARRGRLPRSRRR